MEKFYLVLAAQNMGGAIVPPKQNLFRNCQQAFEYACECYCDGPEPTCELVDDNDPAGKEWLVKDDIQANFALRAFIVEMEVL